MQRLFTAFVFAVFFVGLTHAERADATTHDPSVLKLASGNALVIDTRSGELLYSKNAHSITPIASITKLMTAMVVLDAGQSLDEEIQITADDVDTVKGSQSRLPVGTRLTRSQLMHVSLMSSDNRAAHALGRSYPGGMDAFVSRMNAKAQALGMANSHFVEPTGLSEQNVSTAHDLAKMVKAAGEYSLIELYSTNTEHYVEFGNNGRVLGFRNTNGLTRYDNWDIRVSKTGYIREAGRCLVMLASISSREVAVVLLDSFGSRSRTADALRVKYWLETGKALALPKAKAKKKRSHRAKGTTKKAAKPRKTNTSRK